MDQEQDVFQKGFEARRRLQKLLNESQEAESDLAGQLFDVTLDGVRGLLDQGEVILRQPLGMHALPPSLRDAALTYRLSYLEMQRLVSMTATVEGEIDTIEATIGGLFGRFFKRNKDEAFQRHEMRRSLLTGVRAELKALLTANVDRRRDSARAWFETLLASPRDQGSSSGIREAFSYLEKATALAQRHWSTGAARQQERIGEARKCLETMEHLYSKGNAPGDSHGD